MINNIKTSKAGFTLIEVIIAMGLIMATLLLFGVAVSTVPLTKTARNQNIAYHIAAKKIEEIKNIHYDLLPPSSPFTDPRLNDLHNASAHLSVEEYESNAMIKKVTVTIDWLESGSWRNIDLVTLVTR